MLIKSTQQPFAEKLWLKGEGSELLGDGSGDGNKDSPRGLGRRLLGFDLALVRMRRVKVGPLEKFNGRGKSRASDWLDELELWIKLTQIPEEVGIFVDMMATRLKEGPLHWLTGKLKAIHAGYHPHWASWTQFCYAFLARFEPLPVEEIA